MIRCTKSSPCSRTGTTRFHTAPPRYVVDKSSTPASVHRGVQAAHLARGDPRIKQLERENARLERKLKQAETIIEIQKKVSEILGIPLKHIDVDEID